MKLAFTAYCTGKTYSRTAGTAADTGQIIHL